MATLSDEVNVDIPQHQVFINFRGDELRNTFVSHLENRLTKNGINVFIDSKLDAGQDLDDLIQRIEESPIALAIFSPRYTESKWCLRELAKMKERMDEGKLLIIPVFYRVKPGTVKKQMESFGDKFRKLVEVENIDNPTKEKWTNALISVGHIFGVVLSDKCDESQKIDEIFSEVRKALKKVSHDSLSVSNNVGLSRSVRTKKEQIPESLWGIKLRLKQLKEKLSLNCEKTRIIGVVGMPGIGKTTLVTELYETAKGRFLSHSQILDVHEVSTEDGLHYLPIILIQELLQFKNPNIEPLGAAHKPYKDLLLRTQVLVVLDNVSSKEQIYVLLGDRDWIKEGSKIVIATNDKALLKGLVDDIYEVPRLNDKDGLHHFHHYAFNDTQQQQQNQQQFSLLSKRFVHYVRGNPLALKILGAELKGKDKAHWESKLVPLISHPLGQISSSKMLQRVWESSYHGLNQEQKDMLLDIACFKSMDKSYLITLFDFTDAEKGIEDLVNKFMINVTSSDQVEMHETLYVLSKQLGRDEKVRCRLWDHRSIIQILENNKRAYGVRSILLDMSDIKYETSFRRQAFFWMKNMRYLKIYSSKCPHECERDIILHFPNELNFPLNELRCLHWLKFPLQELPPDFEPKNLVDLKLPYSKIERVWESDKDAPKLKWINLNHSRKLSTLSGLAKARNVQELNLEGCVSLKMLPVDMQNMELLVFLNLKGCTSLESLPDINLMSLETLILTECSKLKEFQVISKKLETLYLNGTSIKELPDDINKLCTLTLLNMKDCKKLKNLPDNFVELAALQELILSGCSKLKMLPNIGGNMKFLEILLLDDTSIEEIPFIKSLRRLGLSRNEKLTNLPDFITRLTKLEWLDLKYCIKLTYVPQLPPNLQWLDASCCFSLTTIAKPLMSTTGTDLSMEKINSMFIFANCNNLEEVAKEEIAIYAERKWQLLSNALNRCNEVFVSEILLITCFPGYEVPSWFSYETIGSLMEFELPPHGNYTKLSGIAICVVISFKNHQNHGKLSVKFTCNESSTRMTWKIREIIENCVGAVAVNSDHVFIGYINCLDFIKLLECQQYRRRNCAATKATLEFSCASEELEDGFEVLKSGLRFVFESDEKRNRYNGEIKLNGCLNDQENGMNQGKDDKRVSMEVV